MDNQKSPSLNKQVRNILAEAIQVPIEMIAPNLEFGDLPQWDSLGHMELMMQLEEEYGIEINADTIAELVSIAEICTFIEEQQNGK